MAKELIRVQRRVLTLYEMCERWNEDELERSITQLHYHIRSMVNEKKRQARQPRISPLQRENRVSYPNIKFLSPQEIEREHECAICMNKHKMSELLTTECGHHFCKQGYLDWTRSLPSRNKCPTCRKEAPLITVYECS